MGMGVTKNKTMPRTIKEPASQITMTLTRYRSHSKSYY